MRCQLYGHTKSYCNRPYVCVKCGGQHSTDNCKKSKTTPTFALCAGGHPAKYKGCDYYQKQYQAKYNNNRSNVTQSYTPHFNHQQPAIPRTPNKTYAQAIRDNGPSNTVTKEEEPMSLRNFLGEFKATFNQLIQRNNMVLNLLTMLISKLNNG